MTAPTSQPVPALELRGVVKHFHLTVALDGVDLVARAGEVHALLGENGAGKSTAMRIAYGITRADAGSVRIMGRELSDDSVRRAAEAGLGMVHQHLSLVPTFTAAENLALGGRGLLDRADASAKLRAVADASGLRVDPGALVSELSPVEQQRLEILKALARGARVLILDEPTAVLAPSESDELLRWLRRFADSGGTVVLVTHKLREALAVADAVTVLRRGRVVLSARAGETSEADLARAMFPEQAPTEATAARGAGERVVRLVGASIRGARGRAIRDANLELHRGEIVGIAAVEGSGHRELLSVLAGLASPERGSVDLPPRIAFIPADRSRDAAVEEFTLTENVALHDLAKRRGLMPWAALRARTQTVIEQFGIAAASPDALLRSLSGGNQQRLVVARALEHELDLVVADNPTRGLDLRATTFVHQQLRLAAARGAAVVVHSSDLDEVLALATRVVVVFDGAVQPVRSDRALVGMAMVGSAA